jgi:hypothetical protein
MEVVGLDASANVSEEPLNLLKDINIITSKDSLDATLKINVADLPFDAINLRIVCTGLSVLQNNKEALVSWIRGYHKIKLAEFTKRYEAKKTLLTPEEHEPFILSEIRCMVDETRSGCLVGTKNTYAVRLLRRVYGDEKYDELNKLQSRKKRKVDTDTPSDGEGDSGTSCPGDLNVEGHPLQKCDAQEPSAVYAGVGYAGAEVHSPSRPLLCEVCLVLMHIPHAYISKIRSQ